MSGENQTGGGEQTGTIEGPNVIAMPAPPAHVRVLLLDDDPATLLLRAAILRQNGYECLPASSVEEANELLDTIDVALLDYYF